jgi:GxxExxY protein
MRIEPPKHVDEVAHRVIGAALAVHRILGAGFTENVYENALCLELEARGIAYARQLRIPLFYRGEEVGAHVLDVLAEDAVVVELKAIEMFGPVHVAQINAYLRATGKRIGLLINFNVPLLRDGLRRVIHSPPTMSRSEHTR